MVSTLKRQWRELRKGSPGHRFRAQYERNERAWACKSFFRRWATLFVTAVLLLVGAVLLFIPGPGIPFLIVGASLLAEQFRPAALAFDWSEIKLRKITSRGLARWRQASIAAKGTAAFLLASAIAGAGYGAFHVVFRS